MQTRSAVGKPASQFSFVIWPIPVGVFAALVQVVLHYFFCLTICPPHVHLVIATRTDPPWPLARMRTRQEMIELRTQDLRFTPDEAAAFLRTTTGLALPAKSICALEARTEGWIAACRWRRLRCKRLRRCKEAIRRVLRPLFRPSVAAIALSWTTWWKKSSIAKTTRFRRFYFTPRSSILDRLTAPLCDAVLAGEGGDTSHAPPDSQSILAQLERANLFLVPLDDERCWYRYHHLFADLLRKRLQEIYPDQVSKDHVRASEWHESQGAIHEAVMHAQAAGDDDRVVYLIERYAGQALMQGEVVRVGRWIEVLPEETIRSRPLLCLVRAWTLITDPDTRDHAVSWLERGLALSAADPRPVRDLDGTTRTDYEIISQNALMFRVNLALVQQTDPEEFRVPCPSTRSPISFTSRSTRFAPTASTFMPSSMFAAGSQRSTVRRSWACCSFF
jgi:LuxR family maltose regulon positive regulatory protein